MRAPVFIFQPFERKGCAWPDFRHKSNSGHGSGMPSLMKTIVRVSIKESGHKRAWIQKQTVLL